MQRRDEARLKPKPSVVYHDPLVTAIVTCQSLEIDEPLPRPKPLLALSSTKSAGKNRLGRQSRFRADNKYTYGFACEVFLGSIVVNQPGCQQIRNPAGAVINTQKFPASVTASGYCFLN